MLTEFLKHQPHVIFYVILAILYFILFVMVTQKQPYYGLYIFMGLAYSGLVFLEFMEYQEKHSEPSTDKLYEEL